MSPMTERDKVTAAEAVVLLHRVIAESGSWQEALTRLTGAIVVMHGALPPETRVHIQGVVRTLIVHLYQAPPWVAPPQPSLAPEPAR